MATHFEEVEKLFTELFAEIGNLFSESELAEVQEFINAGEYGIALETLVDIFAEEHKTVSTNVVALIKQLASTMAIESVFLLKRITRAN